MLLAKKNGIILLIPFFISYFVDSSATFARKPLYKSIRRVFRSN
jgi:hypothetical protein